MLGSTSHAQAPGDVSAPAAESSPKSKSPKHSAKSKKTKSTVSKDRDGLTLSKTETSTIKTIKPAAPPKTDVGDVTPNLENPPAPGLAPLSEGTRAAKLPPSEKAETRETTTHETTTVDQEASANPPVTPPTLPPPAHDQVDTRLDSPNTVTIDGALLGLAIPFKYGFSYTRMYDRHWMFEASYFSGSLGLRAPILDVGGIRENLLIANARYFPGRTFNWMFGIARQAYDAKLGNSLLSHFTGTPTTIEVVQVSTLGVELGLGNRWQWHNGLTINIDWLVVNIPLITLQSDAPALNYVTNDADRGQIDDILKIMRFIPTGAAAKLGIGYSF